MPPTCTFTQSDANGLQRAVDAHQHGLKHLARFYLSRYQVSSSACKRGEDDTRPTASASVASGSGGCVSYRQP